MTAEDRPFVWDTPAAADAYRDRDMRLARELIFPTALRRIGPCPGPGRTVLDIGCGTGAVAAYLADTGGWTVDALDPSPRMLDIARADRAHARITYRLFDGHSLAWLADDSIDAAVCCLVYCADADSARLSGLTAEIHRVLRPGAPYVLADLNPEASGVAFSTLRHGDPGVVYADGDTVSTELRLLDGTTITTATTFRPSARYRSFLTDAGFPDPAVDLPTLPSDGPAATWPAETHTAPYMILTARK